MLFGKLPAHGDFVARGIDAEERDELDRWLSASLLDAQTAHGEAFPALYERAPPWRFAVSQGDAWRAGAIVPSVDAAGRRFPAMAGYVGLDEREAAGAAAAAEALLYRALTEGLSADAAMAALIAADATPPAESEDAAIPVEGWWTLGGTGDEEGVRFAPARVDGARPATLARLMLTAADA